VSKFVERERETERKRERGGEKEREIYIYTHRMKEKYLLQFKNIGAQQRQASSNL
jgi:hypothetical protein